MKQVKVVLLVIIATLWCAQMTRAGDSVRVSLITMYPGSSLYELYGHTELRIVDGQDDFYFNYGLFDFNAPNFVFRFVAGETDYLCGAIPAKYALKGYEDRKVVEQVLNLTPKQVVLMCNLLKENALPQNATYRYRFLSDNCATRPRDIVEEVLAGNLRYVQPKGSSPETARDIMSRYCRNYPWEQFGIDLALGADADTVMSDRAKMFVPLILMHTLSHAQVNRDGSWVPLVQSVVILNEGSDDGAILPPTSWYATPMAMALLLLLFTGVITVLDIKRGMVSRWCDTMLYFVYAIAGCVIFFLIFISVHESTSPNFNAFWLHPFYLLPAVLVWCKRETKWLKWFHVASLGEMTVFLLVAPFLPQHFNAAFYVLMFIPMLRSLNYIFIARKCSATIK